MLEKQIKKVLIKERRSHMGSIVLGLNDALVELTGVLAGLSFALQNTRLIAMVGLVTGIAASMSMAISEYLSKKSEDNRHPIHSAIYTGIAYIVTVFLLIVPYLVLDNYVIALGCTLVIGVLIIALFTYINNVSRNKSFVHDFWEMTILSFGVALISFVVGVVLRQIFGIDI